MPSRRGLPAHGSTRAPHKVAASVSPEKYEIVDVRASRGLSRPIVLKIHTERGAIVAPNGAAASAGCSPEAGSLPRVKAAPAERPSSEGWIEHHRVRSALLSEVVSANRASRVQWRPLTDPEHRYGSNSKLSSARNRSKRRQRASSGKERQPTQVVGHALGVTDILGPEIFGGEDGTTFATSSPFHPSR
jgi:hypothetical protein